MGGNIRVLYLHALECTPGTLNHKLLDCSFDVYCPPLRSGEWIRFIKSLAGVFIGTLVILCVLQWVVWYMFMRSTLFWVPFVGCVVLFAVLGGSFWLLMRCLLRRCLSEAVEIAQEAYQQWEPNIIVGQSFGAVVACHMEQTWTPLLLLSPANKLFHSWAGIPERPTIKGYPFVTVVHGALDQMIPLLDSVELTDEAKYSSYLEIVPCDDHRLQSVRELELKEYVHTTVYKVDPELGDTNGIGYQDAARPRPGKAPARPTPQVGRDDERLFLEGREVFKRGAADNGNGVDHMNGHQPSPSATSEESVTKIVAERRSSS